ncbi:hypothetical protein BGZ73_002345 [Actinomortierella ambigua]|nr:hypothetical protein BGZ73_002345 [Actinomortierella ambigua]
MATVQDTGATLRQTVTSFLRNEPQHLILDIRSAYDHRARQLSPSLNLPAKDTTAAHLGYQLPSKQVRFVVLGGPSFDQPDNHTHTNNSQQQKAEYELLTWIRENGWSVPHVFHDSAEFWETMEEALQEQYLPQRAMDQVKETDMEGSPTQACWGDDACRPRLAIQITQGEQKVLLPTNLATTESTLQQKQRALYRPYLFKPNPWLAKTISTIELDLLQTRSSGADQKTTKLRCLDLGCGAGRDMTYLVSRALNCLQPDGSSPQWTTLGIDSFIGACEKSITLAKTTLSTREGEQQRLDLSISTSQNNSEYAARISTLVAKVDSKTGVLWVDKAQLEPTSVPPLVLPNVRYHDRDLDEQCMAALESPSSSSSSTEAALSLTHECLPPTRQRGWATPFDLIVMIRFLERNAMSSIVEHWLAPGGFVLLSHFVQDTDLPVYTKPGPHHRLQSKTEARDWLTRLGLEVVVDEISAIEDGRPVSNVLARKPLE